MRLMSFHDLVFVIVIDRRHEYWHRLQGLPPFGAVLRRERRTGGTMSAGSFSVPYLFATRQNVEATLVLSARSSANRGELLHSVTRGEMCRQTRCDTSTYNIYCCSCARVSYVSPHRNSPLNFCMFLSVDAFVSLVCLPSRWYWSKTLRQRGTYTPTKRQTEMRTTLRWRTNERTRMKILLAIL